MFKVTNGNTKLGGGIYAINLPAIVTCREDAPCKKLCYGRRGRFTFPAIKNCYGENLRCVMEDMEQVEKDILKQLPIMGFCRIHATGDFVNEDYFKMLLRVANQRKKVKFMAFTKKYEMVNEYIQNGGIIPNNFKIIFSGWIGLEMVNPYNFPTAFVNLKKETDERIKKSAIPCSGKCYQCFVCWNLKKGQQVKFEQH